MDQWVVAEKIVPLAHHWDPFSQIASTFLFGGFVSVFVPTSVLSILLGYFGRRPWGVIAGTLMGGPTILFVILLYSCFGCQDHQIYRQILQPGGTLAGGLTASFILSWGAAQVRMRQTPNLPTRRGNPDIP